MSNKKMTKALIKLASQKPELRGDLLPIITASLKTSSFFNINTLPGASDFPSVSPDPFYRTLPTLIKTVSNRMLPVDWDTFLKEKDSAVVVNPDTGQRVKIRSLNGPKGARLKTQLWEDWREPRESYNRKLLVAEVAANTGKAVSKVTREIGADLNAALLEESGRVQEALAIVADSIGEGLPPSLYNKLFGPTQGTPALVRLAKQSKFSKKFASREYKVAYFKKIIAKYPELQNKIVDLFRNK